MIVISLLAAVAAWRIRRQLLDRLGSWNASLLAIGAYIAVIAVAQLILPAVHETPNGFPADVLYRFRLASLGINLTLWTAIGLGFGAAAERLLAPSRAASRAPGPAAARRPRLGRVSFVRGESSRPDPSEQSGRQVIQWQRAARSTRLADATLACARCDAPVAIGPGRLTLSDAS